MKKQSIFREAVVFSRSPGRELKGGQVSKVILWSLLGRTAADIFKLLY
jgi:hypothetical protein